MSFQRVSASPLLFPSSCCFASLVKVKFNYDSDLESILYNLSAVNPYCFVLASLKFQENHTIINAARKL